MAVAVTPLAVLRAPAGAAAQTPDGAGDAYVIAEPCIGTKDAACVAVCPVDAIHEGEDQYYINPNECIACGACEPECPVTAIFAGDSVPVQWQSYVEKNRRFFVSPAPAPRQPGP